MFISIDTNYTASDSESYPTFNILNNTWEREFLIKDTKFISIVRSFYKPGHLSMGYGIAVIKCYTEEKLNVAANFMMFLKYAERYNDILGNNFSYGDEFEYQAKNNPLFDEKLQAEVKKYQALI